MNIRSGDGSGFINRCHGVADKGPSLIPLRVFTRSDAMQSKANIGVIIIAFFSILTTQAQARDPADVFAGKVILSTKPFPASFKNDRAFVRYMKKAHKKVVYYPKSNTLNLEFMGFFGRVYAATEYTCLVCNVTDRNHLV